MNHLGQQQIIVVVAILLPLAGCASDSEKARVLLDLARMEMHNENEHDAKRWLNETVVKYGHTQEATQASIFLIGYAITSFERDCGRYPTSNEGLKALLINPGVKSWHGPYLPTDSRIVLEKFDYKPYGRIVPDVVVRTAKP